MMACQCHEHIWMWNLAPGFDSSPALTCLISHLALWARRCKQLRCEAPCVSRDLLKGSRPQQTFVVFLSWELRTDILLQWLCCWVVVWLCGFVVASKATFDLCMICSWIGFRWRSALNRIKSFYLPHSRTTLHTDKEWKNNELNIWTN